MIKRESEIDNYPTNDFLAPKLHSYLRENCYLSFFDSNIDIKRQLEEIAERQDGSVVCDYKELFTTILDQFEEGTPSNLVAEKCLTAVNEFEIQYIKPEDTARKHKREGRGLIGEDSTAKKNKLSALVTKYAKRIIEEEQVDAMEECQRQKKILLDRRKELEESIKILQEELKEDIEKIQPDPLPVKETQQSVVIPKKQKNKKKKDDHATHANSLHNSNIGNTQIPHQSHTPHIQSSQPQQMMISTVNKEPQISMAQQEEFKDRNENEMRLMIEKLMELRNDELKEITKILGTKPEDDIIRFDIAKIPDNRFKAMKEYLLKK